MGKSIATLDYDEKALLAYVVSPEAEAELKATVVTPGGRVGNNRKLGSRSNGANWVERSKPGNTGSLPEYIRIIRNGIMKQGKSEGQATALAVAAVKRWASGRGGVSAKVKAAAAKALAEWEAMKAKKSIEDDESFLLELKMEGDTLSDEDPDINTKDAAMPKMEYKEVGVAGFNVVDDEHGIVETLVSVTGLRDNVKDVIHPGAYEKTLATRTPKGVWSHAWDTPVGKALDVKELMPGDPELPSELPDGTPWPAEAGALKIKTQFNLETQRGREAYSDVKFYGPDQEWSIGYQVPVGGATVDSKTGVRHIKTLELYEYSPVLFGAMSAARTQSVKSLVDEMVHTIPEDEFKSWLSEFGVELKEDPKKSKDQKDPDDDGDDDEEDESPEVEDSERITDEEDKTPDDEDDAFDLEDEDEEDQNKHKSFPFPVTAYEYEQLVATRDAIDSVLQKADAAFFEDLDFKATDDGDGPDDEEAEAGTLAGAVEAQEADLGDLYDDIYSAAQDFDKAVDDGDQQAIDDAGDAVLTLVEQGLEEAEGAQADALSAVAQAVADLAPEEDTPTDESDTEKKGTRTLPPKPQNKSLSDDEDEDEPRVVKIEAKDIRDLKMKMLDGLLP